MIMIEKNTIEFIHNESCFYSCWLLHKKGVLFEKEFNEGYFSKQELLYYKDIKNQKRKEEFFYGRYLAKLAILELTKADSHNLNEISIIKNIFGYPVIQQNFAGLEVNISHKENFIAAIVYSNQIMMGIDIENLKEVRKSLQLVADEQEKLLLLPKMEEEFFYKLLWTCKEALGKCLKVGIGTGIQSYILKKLEEKENGYWTEFLNFPQFKAFSKKWNDSIYTVVFPKSLDIHKWNIMEEEYEI
ncbi:4'-phosphopantetheinyl transferase family protein [Lachnotalea glycerini]|uniref:4'-phosphopantetheinyl transferase domain-containing protein n=1 Tax=Lachnotalea glycerini TaxID=1763509 RepID=A0A371JGR2_9FIRM|nr:4'-phosphopantetheinyl transferase superfamily protein [Lachnotalea glycerini]RDY31932.1 hypothetical protein CG710_007245 [Lachnotalea glycerini]